MQKPNIIALPTSQMRYFCELLGLPEGEDKFQMIKALEEADFSKLKKGEIGFDPDNMGKEIVAQRKAELGRT